MVQHPRRHQCDIHCGKGLRLARVETLQGPDLMKTLQQSLHGTGLAARRTGLRPSRQAAVTPGVARRVGGAGVCTVLCGCLFCTGVG